MGLAPLIFKIFQKFKKSRNLHICSFLKPYYIKKLTKIWVNNCTNSISLLSYLSIYLSISLFVYLSIYLSLLSIYPRIRNLFGLKLSPDQYGANKKKFSQIGPAVPELLRDRQTDTQTDKTPNYFLVLSVVLKYFNLHGHYAALRPPPLVHTNFSLLSKLWNILEKYSFDIKHLLIRLFYF